MSAQYSGGSRLIPGFFDICPPPTKIVGDYVDAKQTSGAAESGNSVFQLRHKALFGNPRLVRPTRKLVATTILKLHFFI